MGHAADRLRVKRRLIWPSFWQVSGHRRCLTRRSRRPSAPMPVLPAGLVDLAGDVEDHPYRDGDRELAARNGWAAAATRHEAFGLDARRRYDAPTFGDLADAAELHSQTAGQLCRSCLRVVNGQVARFSLQRGDIFAAKRDATHAVRAAARSFCIILAVFRQKPLGVFSVKSGLFGEILPLSAIQSVSKLTTYSCSGIASFFFRLLSPAPTATQGVSSSSLKD